MNKGKILSFYLIFILALFILIPEVSYSQNYSLPETILPEKLIDDIINEVSGSLPYNHIIELGAYNRDRLADEYQNIYWESEYMVRMAKLYGYSDVHIEHLGTRRQWDAETGELWLVEPEKRLIISHRDEAVCLATGSKTADVTADLIFVADGTKEENYMNIDVKGKIVLATGAGSSWGGATGAVYRNAVEKFGALGVVCFKALSPIYMPDQIPWAGIRASRGRDILDGTFGFNLPHRTGYTLMERLLRGEKLKVRAVVKTTTYETDNEITTAVIPGKTSDEIVYVAHLFEGVTKQGAIDNFSGCAVNLDVGRTIIELIKDGKLPQPERTIRFLWVPEISGSRAYLMQYPDEAEKIIAAINLDMVGEDQKKGRNCMIVHLTPHSYYGFLNDICQEFYEYVGVTNRETIFTRRFLKPIFDIRGSRDPFRYRIDPHFGASDHTVFLSPVFKIPSVMLINWPDPVYHSNMDRSYMADPTQLKRVAFITAASGIAIVYAKPEDMLKYGTMMLGKSEKRIGADIEKLTKRLYKCSNEDLHSEYKEIRIAVEQSYEREASSIGTLSEFASNDNNALQVINDLKKSIKSGLNGSLKTMEEYYKILCKKHGLTPQQIVQTREERNASRLVPTLKFQPVDMNALRQFRGNFPRGSGNEILGFADGKRSILDIRNAVSAEFSPLKLEDVVEYFRFLEQRGFVQIIQK